MRKALVYNGGAVSLQDFPVGGDSDITVVGGNAVTLTTTGATNVTLPTSGTLATTAQAVNYVHQGTVLLNNAQIKALPSADVEIAPAPGVGRVAIPKLVLTDLDTSAGAYTLDGNTFFAVGWASFDFSFWSTTTSHMEQAQRSFSSDQIDISHGWIYADVVNKPLVIGLDGSAISIGGHASNTFRAFVEYVVLDLTTGLLVPA